MLKRSLILMFLGTVLVSACYVGPKAVFRMQPLSDETVWLNGKEYSKITGEGIVVVVAYDATINGNHVFDVEVTNESSDGLLVAPEYFYYYGFQSSEDQAGQQPVFAFDPETEIIGLDLRASREAARHASAQGANATLTLLDLFSDLAAIGETKTPEERQEEYQEDMERSMDHGEESARHRTRTTKLSELRAMWEFGALRKTTVSPKHSVQGQVHFPSKEEASLISVYFPVGEIEVSQRFQISRYTPYDR